jgi:hypothetical protein
MSMLERNSLRSHQIGKRSARSLQPEQSGEAEQRYKMNAM